MSTWAFATVRTTQQVIRKKKDFFIFKQIWFKYECTKKCIKENPASVIHPKYGLDSISFPILTVTNRLIEKYIKAKKRTCWLHI